MPLRGGQLILLHTYEQLLTQAEYVAPIIYMYNAMTSVLAYYHRLPMPLEYFLYLLVGLMHAVCNCMEFWTMRNLHALNWVFSRDFDMNWQPTMHFSLI